MSQLFSGQDTHPPRKKRPKSQKGIKPQKNLFKCPTITNFAPIKAQMAESVDALVSNTSGAIHPGSIPGLGTK